MCWPLDAGGGRFRRYLTRGGPLADHPWFKGAVRLCDGPEVSPGVFDHLEVRHGERISPVLAGWRARIDPSFEAACELWVEGVPAGPHFELTSFANHVRIGGDDRLMSAVLWR